MFTSRLSRSHLSPLTSHLSPLTSYLYLSAGRGAAAARRKHTGAYETLHDGALAGAVGQAGDDAEEDEPCARGMRSDDVTFAPLI